MSVIKEFIWQEYQQLSPIKVKKLGNFLRIKRKDLTDRILDHGRVCEKHFISGKAAKLWDRYDPDWVPTQNLGHNKCDSAQEVQVQLEAAAKRDERARDRELKRVAAERERPASGRNRVQETEN